MNEEQRLIEIYANFHKAVDTQPVEKMLLATRGGPALCMGYKVTVEVNDEPVAFFVHRDTRGENFLSHWASGRVMTGFGEGITFDDIFKMGDIFSVKEIVEIAVYMLSDRCVEQGLTRGLVSLLRDLEVLNVQ